MVNPLDVLTLDPAPPAIAKQVLHVGSGPLGQATLHRSFAGWKVVRLDADPSVRPDIVAPPTEMPGVAAESMDAVYGYRVLQQLHAHEVPRALAEFHRVLKQDGFLLLGTPDLGKLAEIIVADRLDEPLYAAPSGPVYPLDLLFGHRGLIAQGKLSHANRTGFTARLLGTALVRAGFSEVRIQPAGLDLWGSALKGTVPATSFTLLDPPRPTS